ncbi:MAG: hypothetical protein LC804_27935 [Acidobacteria bacterium]|nr:hypothetical protein [Acidobacteriota bacterium]
MAVLCAALISTSLFLTVLLSLKYLFQPFQSPGRTAILALDDRFLYIACSMILMALAAVAAWDSLSLDGRDAAILGPLPLPRRTIVGAKLAAISMFSTGFALALNAAPSLLHPWLMIAKLRVGVIEAATLTVTHAAVTMAAGAFGFLTVFGLREILRAILGQTRFRRIAPLVQGSLVVSLSTVFLLLPGLSSGVAASWLAPGAPSPYAIPPLWFLGLHETLAGGAIDRLPRGGLPAGILRLEHEATTVYRTQQPLFRELAAIAVAAVVVTALVAVAAYAWNNRRLPAPDAIGRTRRGRLRYGATWVVRQLVVRRPAAQAGFFFTLHCLSRSPPHRATMTAAIGVGLASAAVSLRDLGIRSDVDPSSMPLAPLAVQTLVMVAILTGFRQALRVPADLRASWTFHLSWGGHERAYLGGVKRAALMALVLPPLVALLPVHLLLFGSRAGSAHSAFGLLIALILLDVLLLGVRNLPFASSYVPSENLKALAPIYVIGTLLIAFALASAERLALTDTPGMRWFLGAFFLLFLATRALDFRNRRIPQALQFDDPARSSAQRLDLSGYRAPISVRLAQAGSVASPG